MKIFDFQQVTPSAQWVIVHNLNAYPATEAHVLVNGHVEKILPNSVEYVDSNTVQINFSAPHTGDARLAG